MALLVRRVVCVAGLCTLAAYLAFAQDWKTADSLPGVDLSALAPAQKATVLKILRERDCGCGCVMKVAECRFADPGCSYSTGLAQVIVGAIKSGESEAEALAAADASKYAHRAAPKLLDDPITLPVAGAPSTGPESAPVTLVEFSDFQCPYCAQAVLQIQAILKAYPSQVRLIFKQFPLGEMHPNADFAAAAAVAAQKQGKFWAMHDAMFANRTDLSRNNIFAMAQQNGLDVKRFAADLDSASVRETVKRDLRDGEAAGVQGTPTLFINGQRYNGPIDLNYLKPVLDAALKNPVTAANRPVSPTPQN